MKTLGEKIRELRRKKGLSQEELAFEIGISRQTVSKWESDSMQPTTENIRSLCDFFDVTAEYFIGDDKPVTSTEAKGTVVASAISNADTETATTKFYSKKKIVALTLLSLVSAVVLIVSAIIGGVAVYLTTKPSLGMDDFNIFDSDVLVIVCSVMATVALAAIVTSIILLARNKKRKMESFVDKM